MNELRPERDIAWACARIPICVFVRPSLPTRTALHIIRMCSSYESRGRERGYVTHSLRAMLFSGRARILPNGVFDCCETSRAEHPLRPRRRKEITPESYIHTTFTARIGLWFVTVRIIIHIIWSKNKSRYRSQTRAI